MSLLRSRAYTNLQHRPDTSTSAPVRAAGHQRCVLGMLQLSGCSMQTLRLDADGWTAARPASRCSTGRLSRFGHFATEVNQTNPKYRRYLAQLLGLNSCPRYFRWYSSSKFKRCWIRHAVKMTCLPWSALPKSPKRTKAWKGKDLYSAETSPTSNASGFDPPHQTCLNCTSHVTLDTTCTQPPRGNARV